MFSNHIIAKYKINKTCVSSVFSVLIFVSTIEQ